jgi:hypothetical protein
MRHLEHFSWANISILVQCFCKSHVEIKIYIKKFYPLFLLAFIKTDLVSHYVSLLSRKSWLRFGVQATNSYST